MRILTHRGRCWLAATAAAATLAATTGAQAQYAPYGVQPQYSAQQPYAGQTQPPTTYAAQPQYGQQQQYGQQPQYAQTQYAPYGSAQQPQYAAQGAYQGYAAAQPTYGQQPYAAPRVAMAFQGEGGAPAASSDNLPLTPPAESVPPGAAQGGGYVPTPTPTAEPYGMAPGAGYGAAPSAGYGAAPGCSTCQPGYGQSGGYESYPSGQAYGACDTSGAGCNNYSTYGGMGAALKHGGCGYWFGGVYGLLMDRDNSNKYPLVFTAPSMPADSYPTFPPTVVLDTRDVDVGFQPGVEFRLGRTFGCGPIDPCNPCCGTCGPRWGLEGVYWTLFEDDAYAQYVDQGTLRTYTMMPMYGLMYDNGLGYRPINEYWDHAPPTPETTDIEVRLARVRSSLEVQNVEVNLLRLSVCGGGCGGSSCAAVCGPAAGGSCDAGCDGCYGGCATPRGSRFSCTGVCGFRWMQFDEDFMFGVDFDNTGTPAPNDGFLDYYSNVENNLFGGQIGCNGMYRIGCKWGIHLNSAVGLYANDIDVQQYFNSPTGLVQYTVTGEQFGNVRAYKTDVAMLGELRLGASYQATCKCRLYGGWRAIGVTGIALATEQTPVAFIGNSQMTQYVNSNGSMILHGLQAGVEWNY